MELNLNRHIPKDFVDTVTAHLLMCRAKSENPRIKANSILAIAGPSGAGKTTNTYAIAEALGCQVYPVQGSDLVAQLEGQGTELLVKALRDAAADTESLMPIVFIDDGDLGGLGTNPNITGTVNGEAIKGFVMAWADNPSQIKIDDGKSPQRIISLPRHACMIITTNRLDHLHPPMLGQQRANVMTFDPQGSDLQNVLAGIFPNLGKRKAGLLMKRFPDQPISFFVSLKAGIAKNVALEQASRYRGSLNTVDWSKYSLVLERISEDASYKDLVAEGEKIAAQSRDANFIQKPKPKTEEPEDHAPVYTNGADHSAQTVSA